MGFDTSRQPAPVARIEIKSGTHHGKVLEDPYGWMRSARWREVMRDPCLLEADIRQHLDAENAYVEAAFEDSKPLRDSLFAEMRGRIKEDDSGVPTPDGPFAYHSRYREGGQHPIFVRTPREGGEETILLDGDKEAEGTSYFRLAGLRHSPDHRYLAWSADKAGSEYYEIRVRDVDLGVDLPDVIGETTGGAAFSRDGLNVFYVRVDDNHRPSRVFRHELGTPADQDVLVYEEKDPGFFVGLGTTSSGRFIVISCHDHTTSEVHLIDAAQPRSTPVLVAPRRNGVEYEVEDHGEALYILTNDRAAEDFRIARTTLDATDPQSWDDVVAHQPGRLILSMGLFSGHMVRLERADGLPSIVITRLDDGEEHRIAFEEAAYSLGLSGGFEFNTTTLRLTYSSPTSPAKIFDYDMESRERVLRKTQIIPSGHDETDYIVERLHVQALDGASIPVTVLRHRNTPVDGTAPGHLYGYGAYGISIPASFSTNCLSLVDRGVVYAIAHIRGGKDKGYGWYRDGKLKKKTNTFDDFIAVGRYLIAEGYVAGGRLSAQGGSAGGLLIGAVANRAPELFAGLVAEVPFVDILNTMLDDSLPLTPPEWPEWGNPITSAEDYETILSYSPYDQVGAKAYPPLLAVAGLTDPRVTYWEPAKWVARLRAASTSTNPIFLKTNMGAGHGGASGRFDRLHEVAFVYDFVLRATGVSQ